MGSYLICLRIPDPTSISGSSQKHFTLFEYIRFSNANKLSESPHHRHNLNLLFRGRQIQAKINLRKPSNPLAVLLVGVSESQDQILLFFNAEPVKLK